MDGTSDFFVSLNGHYCGKSRSYFTSVLFLYIIFLHTILVSFRLRQKGVYYIGIEVVGLH